MKKTLLIIAILFSALLAKAQNIFFPTQEGTVLEYKNFNKRDRVTGMVRYTITKIKTEGENTDITYLIESMDSKNKTVFKKELSIQNKGNKLYVDMSKFISKAALEEAGEIPGEMEITGNAMEIPSDLNPGDTLPDSHIEMSFKMGFMSIKMGADVTDRMVETIENIETKAGNFEAYKLTSSVAGNAIGIKTSSKLAEWLVKGIGIVRSEDYDNNGELNSYTELVTIKR